MIVLRRAIPGLLLLGAALLPSAARGEDGPSGIPARRDTVVLGPGEQVACLEHPFVFTSTLTLRLEDRVLENGTDYVLDPDSGCFTLTAPDTARIGREVIAEYRAYPLALLGSYRLEEDPHRLRASPAETPAAGGRGVSGFTGSAETAGLSISGSKTFGIEVGNRRDLKLRQSLDLRLTGQVTDDVSLLAILSDQDIPFQPEGNTAELSDLDRILVQLESPRAGASLGDISLSSSGLAFLDLQRELEGFAGRAKIDVVEARGAVASARGEFASRQLFGQDGKQGPYRLTDRTGNDNIVVVAGSEKVWLDGELQKRGEEEDYVFDYSLGELTFTSRRVITANSQITVDYQYATGRYRRRVEFASAEGEAGKAGVLRATFFTEGDDADNPFGGELTQTELDELAALGDSARIGGGTEYVGPNQGDYDLVVDSASGEEVFVFVDGSGDYKVTFVNVGDGKGSYEPQDEPVGGRTVYLYVGEGEGRFIPRRDLPAPERRTLGDLAWKWEGGRGTMRVEGAVSKADGNVLSPLDDGDNQGAAMEAHGELETVEMGKGWQLTPEFHLRRVGENFRSPARLRSGFYGRDWNLTGTENIRDENLQEAGAMLGWRDNLKWKAEVGRLALADSFTALRQRQTVSWNDSWVQAQGAWTLSRDEISGNKGRLDRQGGEVTLRKWRVHPRVRGTNETRKRPSGRGERYRDWETALLFPMASGSLRAEIGAGQRLDDSLQVSTDDWREIRDSRRAFGEVEGRWNTLGVLLRYEARKVSTPGGSDERRDTGRLDLRHQAVRGAWSALWTTDIGTVGLRRRTKVIAPDSLGYFDQFGNYVGPGGGYDVRQGELGPEALTGRVDLTTRLRWSPPASTVEVAPLLRAFAWEGFFNLTESSTLPLVQPRYFLSPGSYLNRESTLDGRLNSRQTVDLFPAHRSLGLRLRQELRRRMSQSPEDTLGASLVEVDGEDTWVATVRSNPSPGWDAELEGSLGTRREEVDVGGPDRFVQKTRLRSGTVRGGRRFSLLEGRGRLSMEVSYSRETGEDKEAAGWITRPRLQWSVMGTGRVDVRYTRTDLTRQTGFIGFTGPGASLLQEGWRLDVITEVRINQGIVITGALALDRREGLASTTEGRMEVRGTF